MLSDSRDTLLKILIELSGTRVYTKPSLLPVIENKKPPLKTSVITARINP